MKTRPASARELQLELDACKAALRTLLRAINGHAGLFEAKKRAIEVLNEGRP